MMAATSTVCTAPVVILAYCTHIHQIDEYHHDRPDRHGLLEIHFIRLPPVFSYNSVFFPYHLVGNVIYGCYGSPYGKNGNTSEHK